jgi:hypothetical protein
MATATSNQKKMEYKRVSFDVNEIAPDAPAGEWQVSIPRGKCKVQPTKEDHFPMIIVPIRLDGTDEDDEAFQKALGTELSTFLVFGAKTPRGERMCKLRIREICEAADVDLDLIPKKLGDDPENELEPLIRALEGKKFTAWTKLQARKDTGEVVTEISFRDLNKLLTTSADDDDDDGDDEDKPAARTGKKKTSSNKSNGSNGKSRR